MLSADDTFYRSMGQAAAGGNATNRDAELLALDSAELDADISRREEWLCAQCLVVGKIGCLDGDTGKPVAELDYGPISKTVTAKPWSDPTSNPLTDLKSAQRLVSGASGFSADVIVMGKDAADAFEANANVMEGFNKMFIQQGTLNPSAVTVGDEIPDEDVPARIAKYAVRDQEDVASAIGPGVMKDDEPELQDTARASDDEEDVSQLTNPTLTLLPPNGSMAMTGIQPSPSRSAMSGSGWHSNREHWRSSNRQNLSL